MGGNEQFGKASSSRSMNSQVRFACRHCLLSSEFERGIQLTTEWLNAPCNVHEWNSRVRRFGRVGMGRRGCARANRLYSRPQREEKTVWPRRHGLTRLCSSEPFVQSLLTRGENQYCCPRLPDGSGSCSSLVG